MGRFVRRDWNFRSEDPNEHPYTYEQWREATAANCPVCGGKIHLDELGCDTCGHMPEEGPYEEAQMKNLFNAYLNMEAEAKRGSVQSSSTASYASSSSSSYSSSSSSSSNNSKPVRSSGSGVNWLIFIVLLIFFWPGAIIYLIVKSK